MTHASVHSFRNVVAASAVDISLKAEALDGLIKAIDDAGVVRSAGPSFEIDLELLAQVAPGHMALVIGAVQRANTDLLAHQPDAHAASAEDIARVLGELAKVLRRPADVIDHVKAVLDDTRAKAHWWGLSVTMTHRAAHALTRLSSHDLAGFLGPISIFVPVAASVSAIAVAAGTALAGWVSSADRGRGVNIKLYMWVAPWITTAKA